MLFHMSPQISCPTLLHPSDIQVRQTSNTLKGSKSYRIVIVIQTTLYSFILLFLYIFINFCWRKCNQINKINLKIYKTNKKVHQLHSFRHYKKKHNCVQYLRRLNESGAKGKPQSHLN